MYSPNPISIKQFSFPFQVAPTLVRKIPTTTGKHLHQRTGQAAARSGPLWCWALTRPETAAEDSISSTCPVCRRPTRPTTTMPSTQTRPSLARKWHSLVTAHWSCRAEVSDFKCLYVLYLGLCLEYHLANWWWTVLEELKSYVGGLSFMRMSNAVFVHSKNIILYSYVNWTIFPNVIH